MTQFTKFSEDHNAAVPLLELAFEAMSGSCGVRVAFRVCGVTDRALFAADDDSEEELKQQQRQRPVSMSQRASQAGVGHSRKGLGPSEVVLRSTFLDADLGSLTQQ